VVSSEMMSSCVTVEHGLRFWLIRLFRMCYGYYVGVCSELFA